MSPAQPNRPDGFRIPSLNWLRVFEAAARTESFTEAARILNMSTSAVSQQIGALEHHLKAKLFVRQPRRVTLSDAGLQLLPSVRQALLSIEASAAAVRGRSGANVVRVLANSIFAMSWLAPRLTAFAELRPDIAVHLSSADYLLEARIEDADMLLTFGPAPHTWEHRANLLPETVYPVAAPALAKTIRRPDDLLRHRLIEIPNHVRSWPDVLAQAGCTEAAQTEGAPDGGPEMVFTSTTNLAFSMAAAGFGLALARAPVTDWLAEVFGLVPCLDGLVVESELRYVIATRPTARRNEAMEAFETWLLAEAARSQGSG